MLKFKISITTSFYFEFDWQRLLGGDTLSAVLEMREGGVAVQSRRVDFIYSKWVETELYRGSEGKRWQRDSEMYTEKGKNRKGESDRPRGNREIYRQTETIYIERDRDRVTEACQA